MVEAVEGLAARLLRACDGDEALSLLLEDLVAHAAPRYALALRPRGPDLAAVTGVGWPVETLAGLRLDRNDPTHPVVQALHRGAPLRVDAGREVLGRERYLVLPLVLPTPRTELGAFVCEPTPTEPEALLQRWRPLLPALARLDELDRLRQEVRRLEDEHTHLARVLEALPDPVVVLDERQRVIFDNARARQLFFLGPEGTEGRRRAVELNNLLFSSFLTRSTIGDRSRELTLVDPDEGGDLLFEVLTLPLPSAAGPRTLAILRDVTDLRRATVELEHQVRRARQAEAQARRERDRLDLVLQHAGDPILVVDDQANILLANPRAERLFEAAPEAPAEHLAAVQANDTKLSSLLSDLLLSPAPVRTAELELTDPTSGRLVPFEVVSAKVLDPHGLLTAVVLVLHDQTRAVEAARLAEELARLNATLEARVREATRELEERNRRLEWQQKELERAYQLKSQFLASMSHELRTPINALIGYAALMRDRIYGELNPKQEEALDRMMRASQHLLELINDILDLAKIEAGRMPVHLEHLALETLLDDLAHAVEPMMRAKGLEFRLEVASPLPLLWTDPTKVRQILFNLLANALKFTPRGRVVLRTYPVDGGVEVAVEDTGIGIRPEDQEIIFEDFRQVDQSATREYGGTGLGLSIVKRLLTLLGGTVRVQSAPGQGSTFTVWLPLEAPPPPSPEQQGVQAAMEADAAVVTEPAEPAPERP